MYMSVGLACGLVMHNGLVIHVDWLCMWIGCACGVVCSWQ